ncbi:MAG: metallophosphoesterase [Clostridium sp.]
MKKLISIAFSDLHINLWNKFNTNNQRTLNHIKVLSCIKEICIQKNIPALFCGDLFHKPENLDNDLQDIILPELIKLGKDWDCFAISGNHDSSKTNTMEKPSPSWVKMFGTILPWLTCIDRQSRPITSDGKLVAMVHGIPYLDHNLNLSKAVKQIQLSEKVPNILLLHTDYPGAKDNDGRLVDSVENLNLNILKRFDLVLCGHIHKPQRLSKKVYMVGAPLQQRRTDSNCELGYWEIYSDMSMKFVPLKGFPQFIDVVSDDEKKDDGNYYTVLPKKLVTPSISENKIHKNLSKTKLARQYIREKGIKDRDKSKLLKKILKEAEND